MFCGMRGGKEECRQGAQINTDGLERRRFNQQYLQFLRAPAGSPLRDLLQLLDSLTEVCHPLDHSHSGRDGVSAPAAREDAWEEERRVQERQCKNGQFSSIILTLEPFSRIITIVYTFNEVADKCAQVVGLLLLALAHLHHVGQILADLLQHLAAHLHLTLEEAEQWILVLRETVN